MKICIAQTKPVKGDITANIEVHKKLAIMSADEGAGIIVFPELSLTGYEPTLAKALAGTKDDDRLAALQQVSDEHQITICAGMPVKSESGNEGVHISMIIFSPGQDRQVYSKQYVHESELPYFVSGRGQLFLNRNDLTLAPAICYEMSVPEHIAYTHEHGAGIYLGSVAKDAEGLEKSERIMPVVTKQYSIIAVMANSVGQQHDFMAVGRSSVWNAVGKLVAQLDDTHEGILVYDTETDAVITKYLDNVVVN